MPRVGQMHRAALAAVTPVLAQQPGHDPFGVRVARDGPSMIAIGREQVVAVVNALRPPTASRFLTDQQVQEAADLALRDNAVHFSSNLRINTIGGRDSSTSAFAYLIATEALLNWLKSDQ